MGSGVGLAGPLLTLRTRDQSTSATPPPDAPGFPWPEPPCCHRLLLVFTCNDALFSFQSSLSQTLPKAESNRCHHPVMPSLECARKSGNSGSKNLAEVQHQAGKGRWQKLIPSWRHPGRTEGLTVELEGLDAMQSGLRENFRIQTR